MNSGSQNIFAWAKKNYKTLMSVLLIVFVMGWGFWWANRYLEQFIREVAIQQLSVALHKKIEIQSVSQILGFEFVLKGVNVREAENDQQVASIKEMVIFYNPLSLLLQLAGFSGISNPLWVYIKEPVTELSGPFETQIQPVPSGTSRSTALPFTSLKITINRGKITYRQKIRDQLVTFPLQQVAGSLDYSFKGGSKMNWVAYMGKTRINLKGSTKDPSFSSIDARLNVSHGDLPFWSSLYTDPKTLSVKEGEVNLAVSFKTDGNKLVDMNGDVSIAKGLLQLPALPSPLENFSSIISLKKDQVRIEHLDAFYEKNRLEAKGVIFLEPIPRIQGKVTADALDLKILKNLIPQSGPLEIQGKASIVADVSGELNRPSLGLTVGSKDLAFKGYSFEEFKAHMTYQNQEIRMDQMEGKIARGQIQGKGVFRWTDQENFFDIALQLDQVQVFPLMKKVYPHLSPETVRGKLTGYLNATGSLNRFSGESRLTLLSAEWRRIPITRGEIDLVFNEKGIVLNSMALEARESKILISGNLSPSGIIEGNILVENLPLQEIQDLLPEGFPITAGRLSTDTSFYGPFPDTPEKLSLWEVRGGVSLLEGQVGTQMIKESSGTYVWEKGQIRFSSLLLRQGQSEVRGEGSVLLSKKFEESKVSLSFSSDKLNLEDFQLLDPFIGRLGGKGHLQGQIEGVLLSPRIDVQGEFSPFSIGDFTSRGAGGELVWEKNILSSKGLHIELDGGKILTRGSIDFSQETPVLDLTGSVEEVRLAKVLKDPSFMKALDLLEITSKMVPVEGKQEIVFSAITLRQTIVQKTTNVLPFMEDWIKENPPARKKVASKELKPFLDVDGILNGEFSARGKYSNPEIHVKGSVSQGKWKQENFDQLTFDIDYREENTFINGLELRKGQGQAFFSGVYTLKGKTKIQGRFQNISISLVRPLLPSVIQEISGDVNGDLLIAGEEGKIRYSGNLKSTPFSLNRIRFDEASISLSSTQDLLTINQLSLKRGEDVSTLSGKIPLQKKDAPLQVHLVMVNDALGLFPSLSSDLGWVSGKGRLDLTVEGTLDSPQINGDLVVQDGIMTVNGLPNGVKNLAMSTTFRSPGVELKSFSANSGTGNLSASGKMLLEGFSVKESDISIIFGNLLINNPQYVGLTDGQFRFLRKNEKNLLSGSLLLTRGDVPIILTAPPVVPPPFPMDIDWNVTFKEGGVTLLGQDMNIKAGGTLNLSGPIELPVLQGEIKMLEGRAVLFSNEFRIQKGRAEYLPAYGYDPYIEVEATTRIPNLLYNSTTAQVPEDEKKDPYYDITATIRGRSSNYLMDFHVDYPTPAPVFLTRDRILRLLGHAQALEPGASQGLLSYEAQRYAATALRLQALRKFEASIESALGLESFQFNLDPSQEATNVRISVTKKIGERIYLNYEPVFGGTQNNQARYSFGIRYNLTNDLSIFTQTLQDNNVVTNRSEDKSGIEMNFPIK